MINDVAVVTGGSKGIGRACCEKLLSLDYTVVFFDLNDAAAAEYMALQPSDRLHYRHCDVSDFSAVCDVGQEVTEGFGAPCVLVNNAGIQTHVPFLEMTEAQWDDTLSVNLKSCFNTCRCFSAAMVSAGYGRIVNVSSMSARRGSNLHTHYCASKAGVLGFTRALSLELAPWGVTVNAICPGIVETDIIQKTMAEKRDIWLREMHVKRLGQPEDIANALEFLVKRESGWITGQAFDINGGIITP